MQAPALQMFGLTQSASEAQGLTLHMLLLPSQTKFPPQGELVAGAQWPAPSQSCGGVEVLLPAGHLAGAHWVLLTKLRQAPLPSQVPSRPQVEAAAAGHWLAVAGA